MLNITKKINGTSLTVALTGDLERTTTADLETSVLNDLDGITELILDLEELDYISSAGLRSFVKFRKQMDKQGSMRLINIKSSIKEILDLSGLADFLIGSET